MNKKDKIIFIAATAFLFLSLFVFSALFDDRILSKASFTATLTIELLLIFRLYHLPVTKAFFSRKAGKRTPYVTTWSYNDCNPQAYRGTSDCARRSC